MSFLLDTNVASHVIRGDRPQITRRLLALPIEEIAISSVTEGELLYGVAKRDRPAALAERVRQFIIRVDVLDWGRDAARAYGDLRALCERQGISLAPLDMMIAAQALACNAILVTRDKAFTHVPAPLRIEDWTADAP